MIATKMIHDTFAPVTLEIRIETRQDAEALLDALAESGNTSGVAAPCLKDAHQLVSNLLR